MKLRSLLIGVAMTAVAAMTTPSFAADWKPSGPLKLQIGFGAGGSTDTVGRVLAKVMEEQTGWNVVAENKPGGGGVAMFTGIAKMPPRGSVIGMGVNMPIMVNLVKRGADLGFDLDSFDYVGTVSNIELALVAAKDAPFDDLEGMIAYAKEKGTMPIAFDAAPQKLLMGVTTRTTEAKFNMVSTKSGAESMKLILGGQVLAAFSSGEYMPYIESGDMKVIASANADRLSASKEAKTFVESGVNAYVSPVFYLAMTAGTDAEALEAIRTAFDNALKSDEVIEIVKNAVKNTPNNLGGEGTKKMLVDGVENVKVLFAE